jgi:hypothetical protein
MIRRLALLVVVASATAAHAQPVEGMIGKDRAPLEIDDCPAQTVTGDKLRQIGSEHYNRGEVLYSQGDYRGAVDELAAAYCLAPFYSILKDIGLAYERELEFEKAIAYLERYVMAIPRDAKPANSCAIDPQEDRKNVLARIRVLEKLEAKIRIETEPANAHITLSSNDTGITNRTTSGHEMKVLGGHYTMTVEANGYQTVTKDVRAEIGKPYTFFERLEPVKGKLHVRVVPSDARLYLDRRPFGQGIIQTDLEGGHYTLLAEAEGRLRVTKDVEVLPNRDTNIVFEMPPEPQTGRKQFLIYGLVAGGFTGGSLAGAQENGFYTLVAVGGGAAAGFAGAYFGTPDNLSLGTSSLTITSSAVGGGFGAGVASMFTNDGNTASPVIGIGVVAGGAAGYYFGERFHVTPGDAAVINSGAIWGSLTGALLAVSFVSGNVTSSTKLSDNDRRVAGGIVMTGLAMGTTGGVLLQRYVTVSRAHAALVDTGGIVGIVAALAGLQIYNRVSGADTSDERTSNVALGGMAAGLVIGGVLTRHMDEQINLTPTLGTAATAGGGTTTTLGVGGSF